MGVCFVSGYAFVFEREAKGKPNQASFGGPPEKKPKTTRPTCGVHALSTYLSLSCGFSPTRDPALIGTAAGLPGQKEAVLV